jgi:ABC-2 type transport system permease protein
MTALAGTRTIGTVARRTSWRPWAGWVLGLSAALGGTTLAIHRSYDTAAKIHAYAAALGSGDALVAVNGRVAGIDSLGGVVANEFGFVAAFALPLMGISLVARVTRREEDAGRLDLLLAGRAGRAAPVATAAVVVLLAALATCLVFTGCLVAVGVPVAASALYAASLGALALCFAGVAALAAQGVGSARAVYAVGLATLAAAYLVRGLGDALHLWVTWLSPLGWAEEVRAFGDRRWWPLVVPVVVAAAAFGTALVAATRRDVGSSLVPRRRLPVTAGPALRRPAGLALRLARASTAGWALGAVLVGGVFGALTRQAAQALAGNDAVRRGLGSPTASGADLLVHLDLLLLTLLTGAFALQWVGSMRDEETGQRLEVTLSGATSRTGWLGGQLAALLGALALVGVAGASALALATAWSLHDAGQVARVAGSAAAYLLVVVVLAAAAVALFGAAPRLLPLGWAWFVLTAVVALLGSALHLPRWVAALAPTDHVGTLPGGAVDGPGLAVLAVAAVVLTSIGVVRLRTRDVPHP